MSPGVRTKPASRSGRMAADLRKWVGAPGRIRTCDTRFRRAVLYPLSYEGGVWLKPLLEASLKLRLRVRAGARVAHRSPRDDVEAVERPAAFYATMKPVSAWLRIRSKAGSGAVHIVGRSGSCAESRTMGGSGNGGGHPPSRRPESRFAMPPKSTSPSASSMTTRSPSTVTTAVATTREAPERFLGLSPAQVIASA